MNILILSFVGICLANLVVTSPKVLKERLNGGLIESTIGDFGYIPYGETIEGTLYHDKKNGQGCGQFGPIPEGIADPIILVGSGGKCSYQTKVRNIERAGGKMAIVISNPKIKNQTGENSDFGVLIPSIMVDQKHSNQLLA